MTSLISSLYGLGYLRHPSWEGGRARKLRWASYLASAGRVTLANWTTFLQINALAHLTGTTLGVVHVTVYLDLGFKAEIRIKEVKIDSANVISDE